MNAVRPRDAESIVRTGPMSKKPQCFGGRSGSALAEDLDLLRRKIRICSRGRSGSALAEDLDLIPRKMEDPDLLSRKIRISS